MNIHVWVDFRTDFARFDVSVEPERYIEAMEAIREFCRQHGGVITKETIRISVKEYTINDDLRIVELFKKNPEEFIKKAMETENDPDVVTREDVISKLLGRSVSVKESKIILRKKYYYHPAYVVLDGEVWYFADVKVPPTHMEELKNHFEVTDNGVTNAKRLEITLELDYGELLQVKDVVRRNGSKIKRIFELINEGLENATSREEARGKSKEGQKRGRSEKEEATGSRRGQVRGSRNAGGVPVRRKLEFRPDTRGR